MFNEIKDQFSRGRKFLTFVTLRMIGYIVFFFVPLILARFLAPSGFGAYSLSMMVIYFFIAVFINSSQAPFIVYANEELRKTGKINKSFSIRIIILSATTILFLLLAILFINPLLKFASLTKAQFFFLLMAYLGIGLKSFSESLFMALNKRIENGVYSLITNILTLLYLIALYFVFYIQLETVFLMFLFASFAAFLIMASRIDIKKLFPFVFDKALFRKIFSYTKWTLMGGAAIYFVNWGDNLILRIFVSIDEIGVYNLGYQLFKGALMVVSLIPMYFLPFISRNLRQKKKIRQYLEKKRPKIMLLWLAMILLGFVLMPYLIRIFYGSAYEGAILVTRILLIGSVFALHRVFYRPIFDSLKRYKFTQTADVFYVILNLSLDFVFIYYLGFVGAAIATAITYMFMAFLSEFYYRRYCRKELFG